MLNSKAIFDIKKPKVEGNLEIQQNLDCFTEDNILFSLVVTHKYGQSLMVDKCE